mmetsp:Transcript_42174/g.100112  ORF Transcript_42174/g.100112 Transcript_42174/m.100112 type:complete len:230 (+) Transcript_42174:398-1087(+)
MSSKWVGALGLMSLKTSTLLSSYTTSEGISLARILSKMVAGAMSRFPARWIASQRPFLAQKSRPPCTSPATRANTGSVSWIVENHLARVGNSVSGEKTSPDGRKRGSMFHTKSIVGKMAASAIESSEPARYGPAGSAASLRILSCLRSSAIASVRDAYIPKGGFGLYSTPWIVVMYMSWRRARRSALARAASDAGTNDGPSGKSARRWRQIVSDSGSVMSSQTSRGIFP